MIKRITILPLILLFLLSVGPVAAQTSIPVQAEIAFAAGEYTVGDPIELTLTVTHPEDYHLILPQLEEIWGDFTVNSQSTPQTISNDDGTKTTTQTIDARLFAPGSFNTPPLPIKVTDAAGQLTEVFAPPASVQVTSVLVEGDTTLRDIKPQAELPFISYWTLVIGLVILNAMAGAFIFWLWRKNRRGQVVIDNRLPHEIALDELARIEQLSLPQSGRFKEHYILVSDCVRLYVEQRFSLPALERTTAEIKGDLRMAAIDQEFAIRFIQLLNEADLVKFAKHTPQVSDAQNFIAWARTIIEMTKPQPETEASDNDNLQMSDPVNRLMGQTFSKNGAYHHTEVNA